jgi:hypothetical protein
MPATHWIVYGALVFLAMIAGWAFLRGSRRQTPEELIEDLYGPYNRDTEADCARAARVHEQFRRDALARAERERAPRVVTIRSTGTGVGPDGRRAEITLVDHVIDLTGRED